VRVTVRDGSEIEIRPVTPADRRLLLSGFKRFGERSRHQRFIRLRPGGPVAEAAVSVVDDWQGRGVGRALLAALVDRANEEGVERWQATLLRSNRAMLEAFRRVGAVEVTGRELDTMEICVELLVSEMRRVVVRADHPVAAQHDQL